MNKKANIIFFTFVFLLSCNATVKTKRNIEQKTEIDTILRLTLIFPDTISVKDKDIPVNLELKNFSNQSLFVNDPSFFGITYIKSSTLTKSCMLKPDLEKVLNSFILLKPNETISVKYSIFLDKEYYILAGKRDLFLVYCGQIKNENGIFIDYKESLKSNVKTIYIRPLKR